jgi:putative ABC transport system permease protein
MLRATLKSLLSRKLRLLLSGLAVVLAVMFVAGSFVLYDTLGRTFDSLFSQAYDFIDVQVTAKPVLDAGQGQPLPQTIEAGTVTRIENIPGVRKATGTVVVEGARLIGANGKVVPTTGAPRLGTAWAGQSQLTSLSQGHAPQAEDQIVVNAALLKSAGVHIGDRVGVLTPLAPKQTFEIVGTFVYTGGRDSRGGAQVVAFTEAQAQKLMLGGTGVFSEVDVQVDNKADLVKVRDAVRQSLGAKFEVETGQDLAKKSSDRVRSSLDFVKYALLGFAGVALLVGIFLILNTFSIIVAQRTQELALLRAIGASRRQLVGSVLLEAFVVGLLASTIGLGLGVLIGYFGAVALTAASAGLQVASVAVPSSAVIVSYAVGILVTVGATLTPAAKAARVAPVAAMRAASGGERSMVGISIWGGLFLAIGGGLLALGLSGRTHSNTLGVIVLGVLISFIAVALLTPLLSRPIVSVLGRLFSWSVPGKLGRRNSARNPRRTAITAAAMMIGVALVTAISTLSTSASASVAKVLGGQLQADLVITGQQDSPSPVPPQIEPAALRRIAGLSEVDSVSGGSYDNAKVDGKAEFIFAYDDVAVAGKILNYKTTAGTLGTLSGGQFIAGATTAKDHHWSIGDSPTFQLSRGDARQLQLVGTYDDSQALGGSGAIVISWPDATAGFRAPTAIQAFAKLKPGADATAAKKQVEQILADSPEVTVQTRDEFVGQTTSFFDNALIIVQVLLGVAMLIAVLGIVNTLVLSVLERTRELGMLRAIGLRRGQAMRMVTTESVVISLFGALLGIGVGAGLGSAVVWALKDKGITELVLPWQQMVSYVIAAALVGVVAAVLPAIRAARLNVLRAIAYE